MTDFDRLRRLPELAPSPGQAEAALEVVHVRRRRSLLKAGAATGAAALVAAVMTTTGPSTSVLDQAGEGVKKTATAVPSPTGHGGETDSVTGPRLAPTGPGATAPGGSYGGADGSPPAVVSQTASSPRASSPSDVPPRPRPQPRKKIQNAVEARLDEEGPPPSCTPTPGTGRCGGILHEHGTDVVTFRVTICTGMGDTIEFPGGQEIDLVVRTYDGGAELWRWGRGQSFAREPHTIELDAEECVSWFLDWDYGDEAGRRVPPGRYRVEMPVLSSPQMLYGTTVEVPHQ